MTLIAADDMQFGACGSEVGNDHRQMGGFHADAVVGGVKRLIHYNTGSFDGNAVDGNDFREKTVLRRVDCLNFRVRLRLSPHFEESSVGKAPRQCGDECKDNRTPSNSGRLG